MFEAYHEDVASAAIAYAEELGWYMFPVYGAHASNKAKMPVVEEVRHWSKESTNDVKQLAAWFNGSNYGIGIDCGKSNIVALDADRLELVPEDLPLGEAWKLRGNPHRRSFIFDQPKEVIGCAKGKWEAGEVKGVGGYICLPPSYHVEGGSYVWLSTEGSRQMPEEVRQMLTTTTNRESDVVEFLTQGEMCAVMKKALLRRVNFFDVREGGRYQQMVQGSYEIAALGAEGHEGSREALKLLHDSYVEAVRDTRSADVAHSEFMRAVRDVSRRLSGVRRGDECLGGRCSRGRLQEFVYDASTSVVEGAEDFEREVRKRIVSLRVTEEAKRRIAAEDAGLWVPPASVSLEVLALEASMPERIEKLLPDRGLALLVAQRKAGKTTTLGNVVKSFCDGSLLFDHFACGQEVGAVALLDLEMTPAKLGEWLSRLRIENKEKLLTYSLRGRVGKSLSILLQKPERFSDWLRSEGATSLIVDPIAPMLSVLGIEENDNSGVRRFLTLLMDCANEAGVGEVVIAHHSGKGEGVSGRGASSFEDVADCIWRLRREKGMRLFSAFGRGGEVEEKGLVLEQETGELRYVDVVVDDEFEEL